MSFEPIDWEAIEQQEASAQVPGPRPCNCGADRCTWFQDAQPGQVGPHVAPARTEPPCTTKRVKATFTATFHGSYVPEDEIRGRLKAWLDTGFSDRDDLRGWDLTGISITTEHGDPDGYDR